MIKPVLKTLSLSFTVLATASMASAAEQNPRAQLASMALDSVTVACATQADVDRGWDYQVELLEARLAAKSQVAAELPGTVVTPPFEKLAPYRADLPAEVAARQTQRTMQGSVADRTN